MVEIIHFLAVIILCYFFVLWSGYLILLLASWANIIKKYQESIQNQIISLLNRNPALPVTVIIPAYNELKRIDNAVNALLNLNYNNVHIIIVNDGSTDNTLDYLIEAYDLFKIPPAFNAKIKTGTIHGYYISSRVPNFMVIDKEHSPFENSAADCINAGLNACRTPLYLTVDSDTLLEKEALSRMLYTYFINPHCIVVGGAIYVPDTQQIQEGQMLNTNIPKNPVLGVQVSEYLRSFIYGREGWGFLGGALCFPGAFTLFETKAVRDVGGYDSANFSYDAEITMQLHHYMRKHNFPYTAAFSPSAISWSEEPQTLKSLWSQRNRWQRGLLRCLGRHKGMLLNPKYGIVGLVSFPYFILFEIFGPVVEAISYILFLVSLFFLPWSLIHFIWLLLLAWSFMLLITMACMVLSILTYNKYYTKLDILHIFGVTWLDMMFYRQWRAFCALFSSIEYVINRIRGRPE